MQWSETSATAVTLATSGNVINGVAKAADGAYHVNLSSGTSSTNVYISNAAVTGDIWAEIDGTTSAGTNSFCGVKQGKALTGNAYFRVADTHEGSGQWGTWFGALNGGSISGDLYMEFSSASWDTAAGTTYGGSSASVAGSYSAGVGGTITMVINAGTFRSGIWGGNLNGNFTIGATDVHIYGGTIMNNIHAGSAAGTISNGAALTFTGENYALNGVSHISAGGTGGTINGGTTLTIDGMDSSSQAAASGYGMSGYTGELSGSHGGTVNGQRTLEFKNSTHESGFGATLQNFDRITFSKSNISLGAGTLGGATTLELDPESILTLTEGTYGNMHVSSSGTIVLQGADLGITAEGNDSQVSGTYRVESGSLSLGDGYITQSTYTINGGTLNLGDGVEMKGSLSVASGASITVAQGANATISGTATIHRTALNGTLNNNGTVTLTGVRGQTVDFSKFTGNGTVILSNAGSGHIMVGDATSSTFAGTVQVDTTGYWFYFNGSKQPFAADADGHYASLDLRSTAASPATGLAMGSSYTHDNALAIGNLSGGAGVAVCGAFNTGANVNRFLEVHQDKDTTFAGKFLNDGNNCVGIIKYGEGNLTLTGANASTAKLEIEEGTITLGGAEGNWAGAITVTEGATLAYSGGDKTVNSAITLAEGATMRIDSNLSMASGSTLKGAGTVDIGDRFGQTNSLALHETDWTGVVHVSGKTSDKTFMHGTSTIEGLNALCTDGSWVELSGTYGYISGNTANTDVTVTANLIMAEGDALRVSDGYSATAHTYTFSGNVKGTGNLKFAPDTTYNPSNHVYDFSGDVSQWEGDVILTNGTNGGDKTANVKFSGTGDVNVDFTVGRSGSQANVLNVEIAGDEGTRTISGDFTAAANCKLNLTASGTSDKVMTGDVSGLSSISVTDGTLTLADVGTASTTISISGDGKLTFGHTDADSVTLGAQTGQTATVESSVSFNSANGGIGGSGTISQAKVDFTGEADQNVASTVKFQNCTISNSSSGNVTINGELKGDIAVDNGTVTYTGTEAVTVEEGKSFEVSNTGGLSFSKGEGESQAVVTITAQKEDTAANVSSGVTFNSEAGAITGRGTLTNAVVEFSGKAEQAVSADISLNGCSIVNAGESLVSISVNTQDTSYALLHAQNSSITLLQAGDLTVGEIKLNAGQTVSAFTGKDANVPPATGNEATLTLTKLTVEGNSTLNANLVFGNELGDAYSLVMLGTVAMGSDVYLYTNGTLEIVEGVKMQVLFTGVDNLFIAGEQVESDGEIFANKLFTNAPGMSGIRWNQASDGWTVTYYDYIPEPTTGTLSILALAALAARRRRRK